MCDFVSRFDATRARIWPHVQSFFDQLPPSLKPLGWSFAQRLARQTAPTGAFADALKAPAAARVVYLPLWHIDACRRQEIAVPDIDALQTHLFTSAFLGFCAIRIHDDLVDEDRPDVPVDELLLANLFTVEAIRHLQRLFPSDSPLWTRHARYWRAYTEAVRVEKQRDRTGILPFDDASLQQIGDKAALLKTYPTAVALHIGREDQIEKLEELVDALNVAIQLDNDIQSIRRDIESGHYTPPLVRVALEAGYDAGTHPPRHGLLGALFLTDGVVETHAQARTYYERARTISDELGIEDLTDFISWHLDDLRQSEEQWRGMRIEEVPFALQTSPDAEEEKHPTPPPPDLSASQERGLDFLAFDPGYRESWEIQRTGVWGQKILIGDLFSRSLIVETLAAQGRATPAQVEDLLLQYRENGWRYYRDFKPLPPDIDDIAQTIRLLRWTSWGDDQKRAYLETPLRWLRANRAADGSFPVWLTEEIEDRPASGWIPLGGNRCIACEANLLEALAECGESECSEWTEVGVNGLLKRWEEEGLNAVYYYKPEYAAFLLARSFAHFQALERIDAGMRDRLSRALERISTAAADHVLAGNDSLTIAAGILTLKLAPSPPGDVIIRGLSLLQQRQSFDGGWEAAELFRCPAANSQNIGWHQSRLLSAATAMRALTRVE